MALWYAKLIGIFHGPANLGDIGEINHRINSLAQEIRAKGDDADIAGALAITKKRSFDAICPCHISKLSSSNTGTSIIMWMKT